MAEKVLAVLDARCSLRQEDYGMSKSCVLVITRNRIVVGILEGIGFKLSLTVVFSIAIALAGLLLREFIVFLAGLIALFGTSSLLVSANFFVRNRMKRRLKTLTPDEALKANSKNFEIPFSDIVKITHSSFEKIEGGSRLFLPTFTEFAHELEFTMQREKHVVVLDRKELLRCMNLLNQFVSEKIEKNENEEF